MSSTTCLPWWHPQYQALADSSLGKTSLSIGCATVNGNVQCDPAAMVASVQSKLGSLGIPQTLSLDQYTLARYMQSEMGAGTIEERVAVGEAGVNQAAKRGISVTNLLVNLPGAGQGYYGPIHGDAALSTAPFGRWAATSQDPTVATLMLAKLVMSGDTDNFANGANDQASPRAFVQSQGATQASLNAYVARFGASGSYWVGPLVGVDHWKTFLFTTIPSLKGTAAGEALIQRGQQALQLPIETISWPTSTMPVCGRPLGWGVIFAGIGGTIAGAWAFTRGLFKGAGS